MSDHLTAPSTPYSDLSRSPSPAPRYTGVLYFAYGSNLWQYQVSKRCPSARYIGLARLKHWRWQVNELGFANVVEEPKVPFDSGLAHWLGPLRAGAEGEEQDMRSDNLRAYGMVYELSDEDVKRLDELDDVPSSYSKEESHVELWARREGQTGKTNILRRGKRVKAMFYCDRTHTNDTYDSIVPAYSYKLTQGVIDALGEGIPEGYINECIRPFVKAESHDDELRNLVRDAMMRGVDVRGLVESIEKELTDTSMKKVDTSTQPAPGEKSALQVYLQSIIPTANGPQRLVGSGSETPRRRALSIRI